MSVQKILFVNQEITPYSEVSHMSIIGRYLPQSVLESGLDIRTFMPRYGMINERRNQLHEVIRLSGQNIVINKGDHVLVIKVASVQSVRMQTYFIDNEEYFRRKMLLHDSKTGKFYKDNDERTIFYARGVLETVKNLGWSPDIIHCHGWMSCLVPLFIRKIYIDNPLFAGAKVIYSVYNDPFDKVLRSYQRKLRASGIPTKDARLYMQATYETTTKLAIDNSDAVVISHKDVSSDMRSYIKNTGKPHFEHRDERYAEDYLKLYNSIH